MTFWALLKNVTFLEKSAMANFWALFGNIWATFYFSTLSHWLSPSFIILLCKMQKWKSVTTTTTSTTASKKKSWLFAITRNAVSWKNGSTTTFAPSERQKQKNVTPWNWFWFPGLNSVTLNLFVFIIHVVAIVTINLVFSVLSFLLTNFVVSNFS